MKRLSISALTAICVNLFPGSGSSLAEDTVTMPVVLKSVTSAFTAPARVRPISNLSLTAPTPGVVSGLRVGPGDVVRRGDVVARLSGPTVDSERTRINADARSAATRLSLLMRTADIEQQKYGENLSTRENLARVQADVAVARQQLATAQAAVKSYEAVTSIIASEPGVVAAVSASNGQFVPTGQALVSIVPSTGLRVVAALFGDEASAINVGMSGIFEADGLNKPIHVKVERLAWNPATPGQLDVWMTPGDGEKLSPGAAGTAKFGTALGRQIVAPSSSLVLDGGQWWVLVHDKSGNHRRHVLPGAAEQGWTVIRQGVNVGERVVVQDAYLLFHEDFAKRYQQAD